MLFLFFIIFVFYASPVLAHQATVPVIRVVDGDTISVLLYSEETKVRLVGVDCYETRRNKRARFQEKNYNKTMDEVLRLGEESKQKLQGLLERNKEIQIEWEERDGFGRVLGHIYINQMNVNEYMLKNAGCELFKKW